MNTYRTLFVGTDLSFSFDGVLCIGTVKAATDDEAAQIAEKTLSPEYKLLGIALDAFSANGHGQTVKAIVSVPAPTIAVSSRLKVSDLEG
jgi:hypothetical protein